jgi:anti-anti-sigma factor
MIEQNISDGHVTLKIKENIVASVAEKLKNDLIPLLKENYSEFTLDFSEVQSIDSSGIGVLIGAQNDLQKKSMKLTVIGVSEPIMKMFQIMRLDKHFNVQPK